MKKGGVYCIENLKNGKKYIGQTSNFEKREKEHFRMLKGNYHDNRHLQNAYNKYGKETFSFKILIYCEPLELTKYEQFFVDYYTPEILYNIRLDCVDSNYGIKLSEETKRKMSEAQSGENGYWYGRHRSEKMRKKLSEANMGKHPSKETRNKMSEAHRRENISGKTIRKMSDAHKGENNSNYGMKGEKSYLYGKHPSKETKRKMSKAQSGENNARSKLTEKQIFEILDLYYNKNKTQTNISKTFPVNNGAISSIIRGKRWKSCYKKFMENNKKIAP